MTRKQAWNLAKKLLEERRNKGERVVIDLGCGYYKFPGAIGLDNGYGLEAQIKNPKQLPDIIIDLNRSPLPFPNASVDEVRSSHFLEHSNVMHIIKESYRVLKPDGKWICTVPYANSAQGMYPGHNLFFTELWFKENLVFNELFVIDGFQFKPSPYWLRLPWLFRKIFPFKAARIFLFNACHEMTIFAKKN
ncbi:MAG: class I SAM-dependent methyltransferase [Patescibacteria group bacterium]|nr:class I SAM-dependent methyltransferase [Patescibacteria group bacterium]